MDEDFQVSKSLAEKRRRYFADRDKKIAEKKGFRRIEVDEGPKGPQFLMVLLCVLGIALVSFKAFGPSLFQAEGADIYDTYSGTGPSSSLSGARLDPQVIQSDLIRLETALFEPDQADSLDMVAVSLRFEIDRVLTKLAVGGPRQTAAARALERLADTLPESPDLDELEGFKRDWLDFRAQHFQQASWFRSGSPSNRPSALSYAAYREASGDLLRLAGRMVSETESIVTESSKLSTSGAQDDERTQIQTQWSQTVQNWRNELRTIHSKVPGRPDTPPSSEALAAIQQLESAFRACESALPPSLPKASDLRSIEGALLRAQFATEAFDKLQ